MIHRLNIVNKLDAQTKIEKMIDNNEELEKIKSTSDNLPQLSPKPVEKFHKTELNPISSNRQRQKSNHSSNNLSLTSIDLLTTSKAKLKPKGILKNSIETLTNPTLINNHHDFPRVESYPILYNTRNNEKNSNGLTSSNSDNNILNSISNSSLTDKRVSFNDNISTQKYKPNKPVSTMIKLLQRQQKTSKKFHEEDLLNSMFTTRV